MWSYHMTWWLVYIGLSIYIKKNQHGSCDLWEHTRLFLMVLLCQLPLPLTDNKKGLQYKEVTVLSAEKCEIYQLCKSCCLHVQYKQQAIRKDIVIPTVDDVILDRGLCRMMIYYCLDHCERRSAALCHDDVTIRLNFFWEILLSCCQEIPKKAFLKRMHFLLTAHGMYLKTHKRTGAEFILC